MVQLGKQFNGVYRQSSKEAIENAVGAVARNSAGEGLGNAVTGGISRVMTGRLPKMITGSTPENDALTDRLLTGGARPYAQQTMPSAKKLGYAQVRAEKTVGPSTAQDAANEAYIRGRVRDIMGDAGLSDQQADAMLAQLSKPNPKVATADVGEHVQKRVQAQQDMHESAVKDALTDLKKQTDESLTHLEALTRKYKPGDLGVDVAAGIQQARADFGTAMSKGYQRIDQMVGDQPLVPVDLIRKEAQRIARLRPKGAASGQIKEAAGGLPGGQPPPTPEDVALLQEFGIELPADPKGKISFADAQRMRTLFREAGDGGNMTRGVTAGEAQRMSNMVDYAIKSAAVDPKAAPAVALLGQLDAAYGAGIKKFNDAGVKKLVADMKAGVMPDPEVTAATIIKPGQEARAGQIRDMVGPDVWNRVASTDYRNLIDSATSNEGQVSGTALLREINKRGDGLMKVVYGDKQAASLRQAAESLARHDGKLSTDAMSPGRLQDTARRLDYEEKRTEAWMKESAISQLADPRMNPEEAYRYLVKPQNGHALAEAVRVFGKDSPQIQGIQQKALEELLSQVKYKGTDPRSGEALSEALDAYPEEMQKVLFPNGMDTDLHLLGTELKATMKSLDDEAMAGMGAGATLNKGFWRRIPAQIHDGIYQNILQRPSVIRYLALGLHKMPPAPGPGASAAEQAFWNARVELRQNSKELIRNLVRYGTISPTAGSNEGYQSGGQQGQGQGQPAQPGNVQGPGALSAGALGNDQPGGPAAGGGSPDQN
jgi:hypothetical protein